METLVIAPHCDDEVLGCGGAIYNRTDVFVYYLGVEDFHIISKPDRLKEVDLVASYLQFDYLIGKNYPNSYSKIDLINELTNIINKYHPKEIFIPNGRAYNQDHQTVYEAALIALRPHDENHFVPKVFVYEVEQYLLWPNNKFRPVYFEKINIKIKRTAYELYRSQVRAMRPPQMLEHFAAIRGLSCGVEYAEAFEVIRYIK